MKTIISPNLCTHCARFLWSVLAATHGGLFAAPSVEPELVLTEKGVSLAPIIVFADAPPFTRQAVDELATYIEKVSGARPKVLEGLPDPMPDRAIWVGYQPKLTELFPKVDFDFKHPEEILIACDGKHLIIAGRDRWDPAHLTVPVRRGKPVNGIQQEYGTCNAVYTFLQDYLDVRWLWPGSDGEDVLQKDRIALAPCEHRYHPPFLGRGGIFDLSQLLAVRARGQSQDWLRFQRLQLDSLNAPASHGFSDWWSRFQKTHPEYFALQPDGSRGGYPADGGYMKICKSNPAVWDQWLKDVEMQLACNPNQTVFTAAANDNTRCGYCICENCRAWDNPGGEKLLYMWQGLTQEYVAMSDRQITFANTLGRMLKKRFPGRPLYVAVNAYGNSLPAPVQAVPDDNVIVQGVFCFLASPAETSRLGKTWDHRKLFLEWAKVTTNIFWRPNIDHVGWQQGLPVGLPRRASASMQLVAQNHVKGIRFDKVWEHWANLGPTYYVLAQMGWNPNANGEAILADYYRRAFGPAEPAMAAYWKLFEDAAEAIVFGEKDLLAVWDEPFLGRASACLDQAQEAAVGKSAVYGRRIAFVRAGFNYLRLYLDNLALINRLKQSGDEDAEAKADALANWTKIERIHADHPLALNGAYRSKITGSIHPDYARPAGKGKKTGQQAVRAAPQAVTLSPGGKQIERTNWTLLFSDDFKRPELGKDWTVVNGSWNITNGCLRGSGTLISTWGIPKEHPPGFQRLEFEAATDVQPIQFFKDQLKLQVSVSDLGCFIHAVPPTEEKNPIFTAGYFFQFGGMANAINQLYRAGDVVCSDKAPTQKIVPDQRHHVVLENDQGTVRCLVDGKTIFERKEEKSILGGDYNRVGFYFYTVTKLFGVKIYVKRLPNDPK